MCYCLSTKSCIPCKWADWGRSRYCSNAAKFKWKTFLFLPQKFSQQIAAAAITATGENHSRAENRRGEKGVEKKVQRWRKRLLGQRKRKQGMLTENKQQTAQWHWFLRALAGIRPQNGPTQVIINTHRAQGRPRRLPWGGEGGKLSSLAQLHANGSTL